jgi:hypothetical protein
MILIQRDGLSLSLSLSLSVPLLRKEAIIGDFFDFCDRLMITGICASFDRIPNDDCPRLQVLNFQKQDTAMLCSNQHK